MDLPTFQKIPYSEQKIKNFLQNNIKSVQKVKFDIQNHNYFFKRLKYSFKRIMKKSNAQFHISITFNKVLMTIRIEDAIFNLVEF